MSVIAQQPASTDARPQRFLKRFTATERFGHWWVAFWFIVTALTGLLLGDESAGTSPALVVHVCAASALVAGVLLVPMLPGRRAVLATLRDLYRIEPLDRQALRSPASLLPFERAGHDRRPWGRFNTGQKLAGYALGVLIPAIYATGIAALVFGAGGLHAPAVVAAAVVLAGHVFLAVINPSTRPALRGMLTGRVERSWAQRHHPRWVDQVEAEQVRTIRRPKPSRT